MDADPNRLVASDEHWFVVYLRTNLIYFVICSWRLFVTLGQGVVLERSAFSDTVIGQALYDNNLLSDEAYRYYLRDLVPSTLPELWRPHVVIYLDRSPEECLKEIKNNGKVTNATCHLNITHHFKCLTQIFFSFTKYSRFKLGLSNINV